MQGIIDFIGQYWGLTIAGSLTVGGLITAIIALVKVFFTNKKNMSTTEALKATMVDTVSHLKDENSVLSQLVKAGEDKIKEMELERIKENQYTQKVQACTFKALSYLIMASKLPTEDKLVLQESFAALTKKDVKEIIDAGEKVEDKIEDKIEEIQDKTIEDVMIETLDKTQTLLEKYKGE